MTSLFRGLLTIALWMGLGLAFTQLTASLLINWQTARDSGPSQNEATAVAH